MKNHGIMNTIVANIEPQAKNRNLLSSAVAIDVAVKIRTPEIIHHMHMVWVYREISAKKIGVTKKPKIMVCISEIPDLTVGGIGTSWVDSSENGVLITNPSKQPKYVISVVKQPILRLELAIFLELRSRFEPFLEMRKFC